LKPGTQAGDSERSKVINGKSICIQDPITGNCVLVDLSAVETLQGNVAVSELSMLDTEQNRALVARNLPVYLRVGEGANTRYFLARRKKLIPSKGNQRGFQKF
jgi:hypothetical protein